MPARFALFAPYVQAPSSPLLVSFRTQEHGLYGSSESYRVELWVETLSNLFLDPGIHGGSTTAGCISVEEISEQFPALEDCRAIDGRFKIQLRSPLYSDVEYSFVVRWPIAEDISDEIEVQWSLATTRLYQGLWVEVERFGPWVHKFKE
eukprot:TRINITY_DN100402_c0_g1_i1.p1 TRINITY_DN100402_c0_g1~~TRINITY_DN100402_c0_g1_i1.p1  ORF type:complete len:175 (-),score=27.54 TRINITY_DN100402_c0_g1_i1:32-478(-)